MGFAKGLLAGIATGAEKVISADIEAGKLETRQLAKLRAERTIQRQDKRDAEVRENLAKTQKLIAQIGEGGIPIVRHYIEKGGLPYAEEATAKLIAYSKQNGMTPANYAGIVVGEGDLPTPMQLAEMATPAARPIAVPESSARGWSRMFDIGGEDAIRRQSDSLVQAAGATTTKPTELGVSILTDENRSKLSKVPEIQSIKEQQQMILRRSLDLSKQLQTATGKERDSLLEQQSKNNALIDSMRQATERFSSEGRFSFQSRYLRLMDEGKIPEAKEVLKAASLFFTASSTSKTAGNSGGFTLQMMRSIEEDAANELGYDRKNPSGSIVIYKPNASGKMVRDILKGPEATKYYQAKLLEKYKNLQNNLVIDGKDQNSVTAYNNLQLKITNIRKILELPTDAVDNNNNKTIINVGKVDRSQADDLGPSADGSVQQTSTQVAEEAANKINAQASSIIGKSPVTQQPKKIIDTFSMPKLNTYFTKNPTALAVYRAEYNKVKNRPASADYNIFIQKMSSNLKVSMQEAEEIAKEFEDTSNEKPVAIPTNKVPTGQMKRRFN